MLLHQAQNGIEENGHPVGNVQAPVLVLQHHKLNHKRMDWKGVVFVGIQIFFVG